MKRMVVTLGLLAALALAVGGPTAGLRGQQAMEKKDKKAQGPQQSRFFELFALPVDPQIAEDEHLLKEARVATDGPALLTFLNNRIPTEQDRTRLEPIIKNLADKSFKVRDKATRDLLKEGPRVLPLLRTFMEGRDLETSRRASKIMQEIEGKFTSAQTGAAVRLLRERRPQGAVPLLLNFLPYAANDLVEDEMVATVLTLTIDAKKIDPVLATALTDKSPLRRAVAALVLGREGSTTQRAEVRKLLADKEAMVRFRAAQGLLCARDKIGVPVLIALLADGPFRYAEQAEDLLQRVAGNAAPQAAVTDDPAVRGKAQAAWKQWWQERAAKFDLAKSDTDLFFANTQQRSRDVTRQFLNSILNTDFKMFQKSTDVPFNFASAAQFTKREDLDGFFKMVFEGMKEQLKQQQASFKVGNVVTVEEYAKKASPADSAYLLKLPSAQTRVVLVSLISSGSSEPAGIVVRVTGPRARVIGLTINRGGGK